MVAPALPAPPFVSTPTRRWSVRRTHAAVGLVATATAFWLGLTAPSVSPVTPTPPAASVAAAVAPGP